MFCGAIINRNKYTMQKGNTRAAGSKNSANIRVGIMVFPAKTKNRAALVMEIVHRRKVWGNEVAEVKGTLIYANRR